MWLAVISLVQAIGLALVHHKGEGVECGQNKGQCVTALEENSV